MRLEQRRVKHINCRLKKDPKNGRNNGGFGFCDFYDASAAAAAKKMTGKKSVKGLYLRIDNPDGGKKNKLNAVFYLLYCLIIQQRASSYTANLDKRKAHRLLEYFKKECKVNKERAKGMLVYNPNLYEAIRELLEVNKFIQKQCEIHRVVILFVVKTY